MSFQEPGKFEVWLTNCITFKFMARSYKKYVDSLELKGSEKVIDYGSGNGAAARFLAERLNHGGTLTCVDISEVWNKVIRKKLRRYENISYKVGDIKEIGLEKKYYDVIFIHNTLHDHTANEREPKMEALMRALKDEGKVYIKEPIKVKHGIPAAEIRSLFGKLGLNEIRSSINKNDYTGVFVKE